MSFKKEITEIYRNYNIVIEISDFEIYDDICYKYDVFCNYIYIGNFSIYKLVGFSKRVKSQIDILLVKNNLIK